MDTLKLTITYLSVADGEKKKREANCTLFACFKISCKSRLSNTHVEERETSVSYSVTIQRNNEYESLPVACFMQ